MFSASDDTDPEQAYTSSRVLRSQNERRNLEFNASIPVSLLKVPRVSVRWYKAARRLLFTNGRTRSFSRTRTSGSHDCQSRRRRGSLSPSFGTAHPSFACLLRAAFRTNWARSGRSGGPSAGGTHRNSYASPDLRSVPALHPPGSMRSLATTFLAARGTG